VPKSYLANFCVSGKKELFRSKFIPQKNIWYNPQLKHIEQICYGPDFYDLHDTIAKTHEVKKDHIERFAFWYEKEFITELIEGVEKCLFREESLKEIPEFYLSMILRNPVFRNALDEKPIEKLITEEMMKVREKTAKLAETTELAFKELLDKHISFTEKELLSQNTKEFIHNTALFQQHFGLSIGFESVVSMLNGYKILFIRIKEKERFFISSNSPGFSLDKWNNVFSFKFKDDVAHYMPISSKITMVLMHPVYFIENPKVAIVDASDDLVSFINKNTLNSSNHEAYCEDLATLNALTNNN
jgi:hypothetical protein